MESDVSAYQKAGATLRAAGFEGAKFHRSGMVRGWGTWSSGFKVRRGDGASVAEEGKGIKP